MLLALTGSEVGIAVVAGVFVLFAVASAWAVPRTRPDYPGQRGLPAFIVVTLLLFVAMLATMFFLADEEAEEEHAGPEAALVGRR